MPKYRINLANGASQEVEGRRFSYYLENVQYWLIAHLDHRTGTVWTVTERSTGFRVQDIPHSTLAACRGDAIAAAKQVIKSLADRLGEARIRQTIHSAQAATPQTNNQEVSNANVA